MEENRHSPVQFAAAGLNFPLLPFFFKKLNQLPGAHENKNKKTSLRFSPVLQCRTGERNPDPDPLYTNPILPHPWSRGALTRPCNAYIDTPTLAPASTAAGDRVTAEALFSCKAPYGEFAVFAIQKSH